MPTNEDMKANVSWEDLRKSIIKIISLAGGLLNSQEVSVLCSQDSDMIASSAIKVWFIPYRNEFEFTSIIKYYNMNIKTKSTAGIKPVFFINVSPKFILAKLLGPFFLEKDKKALFHVFMHIGLSACNTFL